jgi:hypothetical protein
MSWPWVSGYSVGVSAGAFGGFAIGNRRGFPQAGARAAGCRPVRGPEPKTQNF